MSPTEYEQLVEFLGRQFTAIDRRFDAIGHQFTTVDRRFDGVDRAITELRGEMLGHFDAVYRRLDRLEQE